MRWRQHSTVEFTRPDFIAVAAWFCLCLVIWLVGYGTIDGLGRNYDFRAFYAAGDMVRHVPGRLYNLDAQRLWQSKIVHSPSNLPFYHPAYEALLYAPFTMGGYRKAYLLYLGWNLLLLGICYCVAPVSGMSRMTRWRPALLFLFVPVLICLVFGQNSILFLLLLCFCWRLFSNGHDELAGAVLGLALFKLSITPIIALFLVARRGGRFLGGFSITALALTILSITITGRYGVVEFLHLLSRAALTRDASLFAQNSTAAFPSLMPSLRGLLWVCGNRFALPATLSMITAVVFICVLLYGLALVRQAPDVSTSFCVAIVCGALLSPHFYVYDLSILLIPVLLLRGRYHAAIATACYVLVLIFAGEALRWVVFAVVIPVVLLAECASESRRNPQQINRRESSDNRIEQAG